MTDYSQYTDTERVLALQRYGKVHPRLLDALLRQFGDLTGLLEASRADLLEIDGMTDDMAIRLVNASEQLPDARVYLKNLGEREIDVVTRFDAGYPQLLFELNDPPLMLYVRGKLPEAGRRTLALIGAGEASSGGIELTSRLAREFVDANVQIISSMSGGIDAAAHLATSTAGGNSFAVISTGFDELPQQAAMPLAIDLVRQGGVISEYAPDEAEADGTVGQSNRLIVGMAQAVVVTEMYQTSERIHDLVQFCAEIGKLVFFMIDPDRGALSDEQSLQKALDCGAVPIKGLDRVGDIVSALV